MLISVDVVAEEHNGVDLNLDLDMRLDIALPRTGRRLGLFFMSSEPDEMPDQDPQDPDNSLLVGIHSPVERLKNHHFNIALGVKVSSTPALFYALQYRREFKAGNVTITPSLRGFWQSDDGYGEMQSVAVERRYENGLILRSTSASRWTEVSDGIEWSQTFLTAIARQGSFSGLDTGYGLRTQISGHKNSSGVVDEYRVAFIIRRSAWKPWLYIRMGPEVSWRNDENWTFVPGFRIGFDALFWGDDQLTR